MFNLNEKSLYISKLLNININFIAFIGGFLAGILKGFKFDNCVKLVINIIEYVFIINIKFKFYI